MAPKNIFPEGFFWGVGHSAFQVEGSPRDSDWREWTRTPGKILDKTDAEEATDFWNRYDEDFALARELGANSFRLSIAWERIETAKGVWDDEALAHYEKILVSCRGHGLEPIVTLHHFALPLWLAREGGLCAPDFVERFAEYAERVVARLSRDGARVVWWMTFNEPLVMVNMGYLVGEWPPGAKGDAKGAMKAAKNLVRAHFAAVERMRPLGSQLKISIAQHWRDFQPKRFWNPFDRAASIYLDEVFNRNFIRALVTGWNVWWMPGSSEKPEKLALPEDRPSIDYIGINYYGRMMAVATAKPPFLTVEEGAGLKTDLGWEIYPIGLTNVLESASRYDLPILISENGLADAKDTERAEFLRNHIDAVTVAVKKGVDVIGYMHWSIVDNFEWAFGLKPRFGLVAYDYAKKQRRPRPSFEAYKNIIKGE
jgi:beta-glucosidase